MTKRLIMHGECVISELDNLPTGITPMELNDDYVIIAESEVTGNHHRVTVKDKDIEFFERDGVLYAKVNEPTTIGCVLKERHDDVELPVGYWQFKKAIEFDPLSKQNRFVYD